MTSVLLLLAVVLLAYANGANDNFKGVATLYGSGTLAFRRALVYATVAAALGALTALLGGEGLVQAFGGKGLVPDAVAASPAFATSVALGAAATVLLATALGLLGVIGVAHLLSAGAVCFARALDDAPKLVGILGASGALGVRPALLLAGAAMSVGGVVQGKSVAETMSKKITPMSEGAGFCGNLVTAGLVLAASGWSLPVSTTHVSCGALFGIGVATGQARAKVVAQILLAWVTTLPLGAACAALAALVVR